MKKLLLMIIMVLIAGIVRGQEVGRIGGVEIGSVGKLGLINIGSVANIAGIVPEEAILKNCKEIKDAYPDAADGIYTIDPDGEGGMDPFECYCDMTTNGGGWTLVLLSNTAMAGCPRPYWTEALNNINLNGTFSTDITSFDLFLGVKYWNDLGTTARLEMGESPSSLSHRAYYTFALDVNNNYALVMSDESVTIHTQGTASPGMYTYHNGRPLTTRDVDNDNYSSNCSMSFGNSAWWYGSCWSGSFWGGGGAAFQDAPYWTGNGTEHFNYGSIWLR